MKKIALCIFTLCVTLSSYSSYANNSVSTKAIQTEQAKKLVNRLTEIKEMDKSNLTIEDKKQLRSEVLSIQKQLKPLDGGVYISIGGIIIILLLLIIIF